MHCALNHNALTECAHRDRCGAVRLGRAVGHEPRTRGTPRLRGEFKRLIERGVFAKVDAVGHRWDIERNTSRAQEVNQLWVGAFSVTSVAGNHDLKGVAFRMLKEGMSERCTMLCWVLAGGLTNLTGGLVEVGGRLSHKSFLEHNLHENTLFLLCERVIFLYGSILSMELAQ